MDASTPSGSRLSALALTAATVELAFTTAYIHLSLGGALFTLNALGFAVLGALLAAGTIPHPLISRFSWLPRIGLAAFSAATIGAYLLIGPYFVLGWVAKAVELAILTLLAADAVRAYGSLGGLVRAATASLRGEPATDGAA